MKNKDFWNDYFSNTDNSILPPFSDFLQKSIKYLKHGKVLDLACGLGQNSILLAKEGFSVEGIDFSTVAIEKAREYSFEEKLNIEFKSQGLDFYLAPIQRYDTISIIDYKASQRLIEELKKGLVIGGTLIIENYTSNLLKINPGSDIEIDECYKPFELVKSLKGWNLLFYDERNVDSIPKVRAIMVKPSY